MRPVSTFAALAVVAVLAACKPAAETPVDAVEAVEPALPVMPADAPPQEEVDPALAPAPAPVPAPVFTTPAEASGSCRSKVGAAAAARLVERCLQVSPATHPPCNVENSCALIQNEIDRGCAMFGPDEEKPAECTT
ncbi:hypothetical protein [uncultured Brevundimonas sp.]|uniref:hypothetical protein n=1 Tax=uncultured Brevundimonas sp. TaxID=213418 RepID=UPI0030EEA42F|tara:strand:- start:152144 stop:152551 length:408 start_codon:yes stop_codon:yes gene_type:complete